MGFVRFIMFLLRLIFGITYAMSGFLKLVDPVGTGLFVTEYLHTMHLGFLSWSATGLGLLMSVAELTVGLSMIMCIRMRFFSWVALVMSIGFTVLTGVVELLGGLPDCGCFGNAISVDTYTSFIKNICLTVIVVPIFFFRKRFHLVAPEVAEWVFMGVHSLAALVFGIISWIYVPIIEFTDFQVGTDIDNLLEKSLDNNRFENTYIYSKDGVEKEFTIDEIPDETWEYVGVKEGDNDESSHFDMTITTASGEYISKTITKSDEPYLLFAAFRPERLSERYWNKIRSAIPVIEAAGGHPLLLLPEGTSFDFGDTSHTAYSDYKTLITMVRSNGGLIFVDDGVVVKKRTGFVFTVEDLIKDISDESEDMTVFETIRHRLVYEVILLFLLVVIILFRYICGIIYGKKGVRNEK